MVISLLQITKQGIIYSLNLRLMTLVFQRDTPFIFEKSSNPKYIFILVSISEPNWTFFGRTSHLSNPTWHFFCIVTPADAHPPPFFMSLLISMAFPSVFVPHPRTPQSKQALIFFTDNKYQICFTDSKYCRPKNFPKVILLDRKMSWYVVQKKVKSWDYSNVINYHGKAG